MEPAAYAEHAAYERTHWWFVGRRAVLASLLRPLAAGAAGRVLAVGCGFGAELDFLGAYGGVVGTEILREPLRSARAGGARRVAGARGEALPFAAGSFGLVALLDVLEHIPAEPAALAEAWRVLVPGGHLLLTVPALPWLWSAWDVRVHHQRRYRRASLAAALRRAGFTVERMTHFNTVLLPAVAAVRLLPPLGKLLKPADGDEFALGSGARWNGALARVLELEAAVARHAALPIGVSLAAVARREG